MEEYVRGYVYVYIHRVEAGQGQGAGVREHACGGQEQARVMMVDAVFQQGDMDWERWEQVYAAPTGLSSVASCCPVSKQPPCPTPLCPVHPFCFPAIFPPDPQLRLSFLNQDHVNWSLVFTACTFGLGRRNCPGLCLIACLGSVQPQNRPQCRPHRWPTLMQGSIITQVLLKLCCSCFTNG